MNICFLTPEYPHPHTKPSGGIGTSIRNLACTICAQGEHSVKILVTGQDKDEKLEERGIVIHKMRNITYIKGLSWLMTRMKIQRIINAWVKIGVVDIVECADWGGLSAFINFSCPAVIRLNGTDTFFCHLENRPVKWFNRYLEQQALQSANSILAVSDFVGRYTQRLFNLRKEYCVVHNGLAIEDFQLEETPPKKALTILYFGTLIRKKGVLELSHIFNEVCQQVPNVTLKLVGKDARDALTGERSTWGLMQQRFTAEALQRTEYLGPVPYADIRQHIAEASICVFPSFAECWPMSWMEAMAMEKAIVASNIGWATEMIEDGKEGYLVNPSNHLLYFQKIVKLLLNKDCRENFGKNARIKVEGAFSANQIAKKTLKHYQMVLNGRT